MRRVRSVTVCLLLAAVSVMSTSAATSQEVTYLGMVVEVEAARLLVNVVDEKAKTENPMWFAIDRNTKVKREDDILPYADAKIAKGERVAVLVDPAAKTQMLAIEIRLAAPATQTTKSGKPSPPSPPAHTEHQQTPQKDMAAMQMEPSGWHLMQDGVVYGLFNHQGGPRGGDEFVVPNWWMGMWMRQRGAHQFGLNAMLSVDAGTVGKSGYREIFQVGEALEGKPLIDRQHPHDLFMQLAASWRVALNDRTSFIIAGGPAGEPTLGPVAFMHRASAAGLVLAPLGHHTFDSTHISFGVVTAAVEYGRWTFEGSVFNGREPDEDRWDFDFGALDSFAGRIWFKPGESWEVQVSRGRLREPEELIEGDATRTTSSVSWFREGENGFSAITGGYGVNEAHRDHRHGVFGEFTLERGVSSVFGRAEFQQVETHVLLTGDVPEEGHSDEGGATVGAFTIGGARQLATWKGFEGAVGAQVTFYRVPELLAVTHGDKPMSAQVFFRLRLPSGSMGRMWSMRMSQGHKMGMDHSSHVVR